MVGFQGGGRKLDIHWHRGGGFWSYLRERPHEGDHDYFLCEFGTEKPWSQSSLSITVEMNPPHHGRNWHVAGAFARSQDGAVWIAHSGRVYVGREGFSKGDFLEFLRTRNAAFQTETIAWPDGKEREMILIGQVKDPRITESVGRFVQIVACFKKSVKEWPSDARARDFAVAPVPGASEKRRSASNIHAAVGLGAGAWMRHGVT